MSIQAPKKSRGEKKLTLNEILSVVKNYRIEIPPQSNYCRPGLFIDQTTLTDKNGKRLDFRGLFTRSNIPKGAFLGLYRGSFIEEEMKSSNPYAIQSFGGDNIEPPINSDNKIEDAKISEYPLAMINEGHPQNVVVKGVPSNRDGFVPNLALSEKIDGLAFYASMEIEAGSELFLYYGPTYERRNYTYIPTMEHSMSKDSLEKARHMYTQYQIRPENIIEDQHWQSWR
jgi:hypothetical protein